MTEAPSSLGHWRAKLRSRKLHVVLPTVAASAAQSRTIGLTGVLLLALTGCDGEPSCEESFNELASHMKAKFNSCGIEIDPEIFRREPCDDQAQLAIECTDDCLPQATCAALDGTNPQQGEALNQCFLACPDL